MIRLVLAVLILSLGLFCSIKDDNGNPAISGPNSNKTPITVVKTPGLLVVPDSQNIRLGDTLGFQITVFADSVVTDTTSRLIHALVTISTSPANHGWISAESLYTDSSGRAAVISEIPWRKT